MKCKRLLRAYDVSKLAEAYKYISRTHIPVRKAAKMFGVPLTTLRDRIDGRVKVDIQKLGKSPKMSHDEEKNFALHFVQMAELGYGYTRTEVINMATEYMHSVGRLADDKRLSQNWYIGFSRRWPELKRVKPSALAKQGAQASNPDTIKNYYKELNDILVKYDLHHSPERIYNIDEKYVCTEHKAPSVVCSRNLKTPQAITSPRLGSTVIGCGNALGNHIPPYFCFRGNRMSQEYLEGTIPGSDGTVTGSGWSNTIVFENYIKNHLLKYVQVSPTSPLLILYDGHKSHINPSLISWAKQKNIVLFVFPPHLSHVLQPLDVGCFGPFQKILDNISHKWLRDNPGQIISKHNIASIASKAYTSALSPTNLQSSFKKCGIYPFNPEAYDKDKTKPFQVFKEIEKQQEQACEKIGKCDDQESNQAKQSVEHHSVLSKIKKSVPTFKPPRRTLSRFTGGKCITEDSVFGNIEKHISDQKSRGKDKVTNKVSISQSVKIQGLVMLHRSKKLIRKQLTKMSQQPRFQQSLNHPVRFAVKLPYLLLLLLLLVHLHFMCQMMRYHKMMMNRMIYVAYVKGLPPPPPNTSNLLGIFILKWAQCDRCSHWTHLGYCTKVNVVRRHTEFLCPCCDWSTNKEEE